MKRYQHIAFCIFFIIGIFLISGNGVFSPLLNDPVRVILQKLKVLNEEMPEDRVYAHFDKALYEPGETIWFSAYIRQAKNFLPSSKSEIVHAELINPKGNVIQSQQLLAHEGQAEGDFQIPAEAMGGPYKVKVFTTWMSNELRNPIFEKEIVVQKTILPRLKMKMNFLRKAYGPGETATATISIESNDNQVLASHKLYLQVSEKGNVIATIPLITDVNGEALLKYNLPEGLDHNDFSYNVLIPYQGQNESISRAVPIVLNAIQLDFFPEGGDLINGQRNTVAFTSRNEFDEPVDVKGKILNNKGQLIANFESYFEGRGIFSLSPSINDTYTIKLEKPIETTLKVDFPKVLSKGYTLQLENQDSRYLNLSVQSNSTEELSVLVNVRGHNYLTHSFIAYPGNNEIGLPLRNLPPGVAQITLFDAKGIARAERLAMVKENENLRISITPSKQKYLPGEEVELTVRVTDKRGRAMPGTFSMAVVDDQLLTFADDRSSDLLSWMLLEADLTEEVREPDFYFTASERLPQIDRKKALDHLLLTAGWRRFTWKELSNEKLVAKLKGEKKTIQGTVSNMKGVPTAGIIVSIPKLDKKTVSGPNGDFAFTEVDLYDPVEVVAEIGNLLRSVQVTSYDKKINIKAIPETIQVVDASTNEPIPFATVVNRARNIGLSTNLDGTGDLNRLSGQLAMGETLEVIYIGYQTAFIRLDEPGITQNEKVIVRLKEDRNRIEEVMIVEDEIMDRVVEMDAPRAAKPQRLIPPPPPPAPPVLKMVDEVIEEELEEDGKIFSLADNDVKPIDKVSANNQQLKAFAFKEQKKDEKQKALNQGMEEPDAVTYYYRARQFKSPPKRSLSEKGMRQDMRTTIYWNGRLKTDSRGTAKVRFVTSDKITSFRATVEGISENGTPGYGKGLFYSQLPLSLESKLPLSLVEGDLLNLPLTVVNNSAQSMTGTIEYTLPKGLLPGTKWPEKVQLKAGEGKTIYLSAKVHEASGEGLLNIRVNGNGFWDGISQKVVLQQRGFPTNRSIAGQDLVNNFRFRVDESIPGSLEASLVVHPSTLSEMLSGLESMLREPHGCFEQTSSSTYPNIMVLRYLQESGQLMPAVEKKATDLIDRGYKRLISFESKGGGFEWFGGNPAHEGLTAYGLMEFLDMKKVYPEVDQKMIDRTMDWLLSRRDGKGLFQRNPRALHQFGMADNETMSAYIVFALSEGGITNLTKEATTAYQTAMKGKEPYLLGLTANLLYNYGEPVKAKEALDELMSLQLESGAWDLNANSRSAPGSGGEALKIETAALALSALLKQDKPHPQSVQKVAEFLQNSRGGYGGFGNTNSTVLALRALVDYAKWNKRTAESGTVVVKVNGYEAAEANYEKGQKDAIVLEGWQDRLTSGENKVEVIFKDTRQALPFSGNIGWRTHTPQSAQDAVIHMDLKLNSRVVSLGEILRLDCNLKNRSQIGQSMTMAIIGIPAGLSLQNWQLKQMMERREIDFYETTDSHLVLYFREMAPEEEKSLNLDLKAEIPGSYVSPASSAYLFYTNENKEWSRLPDVSVMAP